MEPSSRRAVSTFIQTFMLVGIVAGASVLVYAAMGSYSASLKGAAISASNGSIRQGSSMAIETVEVGNTGTVSFSSLTLATSGISSTASYSVSVDNLVTGSVTTASGSRPATISITTNLLPGQSIVITVTINAGSVFTFGNPYTVYVTAAGASAQQTVSVLPA